MMTERARPKRGSARLPRRCRGAGPEQVGQEEPQSGQTAQADQLATAGPEGTEFGTTRGAVWREAWSRLQRGEGVRSASQSLHDLGGRVN